MQSSKMNLNSFLFILLLSVSFIFSPGAMAADDDADLTKRIESLESENAQLKSLIESMQQRLDAIENNKEGDKKDDGEKKKKKKDKEEDQIDAKQPESGQKEGEKKEKKDKGEDDGVRKKDLPWLRSMNDEYFQLGGRLRFGYYDVENETNLPSGITDNPDGSFILNDFRLKLEADFTNGIGFVSKFDTSHMDDKNALVEAYVDFTDLPVDMELRAGLQPMFWRPNRLTKYYPVGGRAFWADRDLGVTWKGDWDPVNVYAGVFNGFALDDTSLGEDDSNEIIGTDTTEYDIGGRRDFTAGIGYKFDWDKYGELEVLGFGLFGDLDEDDVDFLRVDIPGYGFSTDSNRRWWGVNLEYDIDKWDFFAQAISGRDGKLDRFAWYVEGSYEFEIENMKFLQSIRPLVRYSSLDTNLTARPYSFGGSLTW
ncbi:hypothetical protein K8I31_23025, partial [bacterium]|nr:hypothetical protein [bacterium]